MVMDFGQKVIKVSCPNCEWTEQWMVGNNGSSRCYSVAFNEDGTAKETNISSSEKTIFGHDKIPVNVHVVVQR